MVRFGVFEVDLAAGELRKGGVKIKLQDQPFRVLAALLARPGEVVTREELREKLEKVVATFQILPKEQLKSLRQKHGKVVLLPGWNSLQTKHYSIEYATDKAYAKRVGAELESILSQYRSLFPSNKKFKQYVVKLFDGKETFERYAAAIGAELATAYFSPLQGELVCYRLDEDEMITIHRRSSGMDGDADRRWAADGVRQRGRRGHSRPLI